ncbi:LIM/homeobox protein Lhx9-like, partial [Culicoides brevitarsis]|uniref:LIM/homeobox protein Lhx9-like n=1 Tax=Culicoides brevitarsis TaxID=469753 RepID=UPI00307BB6BF
MIKEFPSPVNLTEICCACEKPILDRFYLLAIDNVWHSQCLRCTVCSQSLDKDVSCYSRDGRIYCKQDYYRLFYTRCTRCDNIIQKDDLVMKAKEFIYHLDCFSCYYCEVTFNSGDTVAVQETGRICCTNHFKKSTTPPPGGIEYTETAQKGRPRKRKYNVPNIENVDSTQAAKDSYKFGIIQHDASNSLNMYYEDSQSPRDSLSAASRAKRVRTSFKHHQLRTMKSYFAVNQNPDAKDLKQLAQKTGLSKRVLQVWFQNARAKYRRNVLRCDSGQKSNPGSYTYSPMSSSASID